MHRRSIFRAMFRYSRSGFSATWPDACYARPAALLGFDPSQSCSCHAGKAARHPHDLCPPAVSRASIPAHFCREIDRQRPEHHPRWKAINHGRRGAAPGLCPRGQSVRLPMPPGLPTGKADTALGLASLRLADTDRCARGALLAKSREPSASGSRFRLLSARGFCWRHVLKCSGKAIAEDTRGFPPILQRIEGLTPG